MTSSASSTSPAQRQAARERGALLLSAGQLLDQLVGLLGESERFQRLDRAPARLARVDAARDQRDLDVLARGEDRRQPVVLRHQHHLLGDGVITVAQRDRTVRGGGDCDPATVGFTRPAIAHSSVVLPAPDGPVTASKRPGSALTETSRRTTLRS